MKTAHKRWITVAIVLVWFCACYLIGQVFSKSKITVVQPPAEQTAALENQESEVTDHPFTVSVENAQKVSSDEIPWGFTAGKITLEDDTEVWLLTPGTSMIIDNADGMFVAYRIHPWMNGVSDGAVAEVRKKDKTATIEITDDWNRFQIGGSVENVQLTVLKEGEESGDWVIVKLEESF